MSDKKNQKETEVKLPKLPYEFDYRGSEVVSMTANEFKALKEAVDTALASAIETKFISAPEWVSTLTGEPYKEERPPQEDITKGIAKQVTNTDKTFSAENYIETYEAWVYPKVVTASDIFARVHARMIEEGVATPITQLRAEYEAAENLRKAQAEELAKAQEKTAKDTEIPVGPGNAPQEVEAPELEQKPEPKKGKKK